MSKPKLNKKTRREIESISSTPGPARRAERLDTLIEARGFLRDSGVEVDTESILLIAEFLEDS